MTLNELAERCEATEGPDRELDAAIWLATTEGATREQWDYTHKATGKLCHMDETRDASRRLITVPAYTASLDAAMTLVADWPEEDMKTAFQEALERWWASPNPKAEVFPRFICAAALRARASKEHPNDK